MGGLTSQLAYFTSRVRPGAGHARRARAWAWRAPPRERADGNLGKARAGNPTRSELAKQSIMERHNLNVVDHQFSTYCLLIVAQQSAPSVFVSAHRQPAGHLATGRATSGGATPT